MPRRASFAIAALVSLTASYARAETELAPNVRLSVEPAPSCPLEADFAAASKQTLSASALASAPAARYAISFRTEKDGFTGTLVATTEGEAHPLARSVHTSTCREAAEVLALTVVLIIDPLVTVSPHFPEVSEEPKARPEAPVPEAPARTDRPPAKALPRPQLIRVGAALSAGATAGILPGVAPSADLSATVAFARVPLELRAGSGILFPKEHEAAEGVVRFWAVHAQVAACAVRRTRSPISLGACGGGSVDWVFTNARDFLQVAITNVFVPSATAGAFARYAFGQSQKWSLGLDVTGGVVLAPTTWNVVRIGGAHETSPLTGRIVSVLAVELF